MDVHPHLHTNEADRYRFRDSINHVSWFPLTYYMKIIDEIRPYSDQSICDVADITQILIGSSSSASRQISVTNTSSTRYFRPVISKGLGRLTMPSSNPAVARHLGSHYSKATNPTSDGAIPLSVLVPGRDRSRTPRRRTERCTVCTPSQTMLIHGSSIVPVHASQNSKKPQRVGKLSLNQEASEYESLSVINTIFSVQAIAGFTKAHYPNQ